MNQQEYFRRLGIEITPTPPEWSLAPLLKLLIWLAAVLGTCGALWYGFGRLLFYFWRAL